MDFIVTARKWRPQLFSDVVGQQHISTTLKNAIESERISHAYIFAGPRGVGKTTTARILAKRLNCTNPNGGEPCNKCDSCETFLKSQSLDIIEIDGASNRRIDEIRTLRESVKYAPTSGKYKVYIIDEVHMLTTESFNALLKTLEEPPEHTIFIFATTDIHKVPLTIISRCQRFDFRRIELGEIKELLKKISKAENIKIDDESLTLIAKKADGALRDAESIFDQVVAFCGNEINVDILREMLNLIDEETYFEISDALLKKDFKAAYLVSQKIYNNGWNFIDFVNGLVEHFRNISTAVITKTADFIETSEIIKSRYLEYIDKFSEGDLLRALAFLTKSQNELRNSQNQKLKVEITLAHLIGLEKTSTITELLRNVDETKLEEQKKKVDIESKPSNNEILLTQNRIDDKKTLNKYETPHSILPSPSSKPKKKKDLPDNSADISLQAIKENWEKFKEEITRERFTLGPLLEHCNPISLKENNLTIAADNEEDIQILSGEVEFLTKKYRTYYNIKINMKFTLKKRLSVDSNGKENDASRLDNDKYKDHPLIKSIIQELGGREIK